MRPINYTPRVPKIRFSETLESRPLTDPNRGWSDPHHLLYGRHDLAIEKLTAVLYFQISLALWNVCA